MSRILITIICSLFLFLGMSQETYQLIDELTYFEIPEENTLFNALNKTDWYAEYRNKYPFIKKVENELTTDHLELDIYLPSRQFKKHVAMIWVHEGGLFVGTHNSVLNEQLGSSFAEQGIVFIPIEYRTQALNLLSASDAGYLAMQDLILAIKFIRQNAHKYNIDPSQIYIGGLSAGAIISTAVGYMDESEFEPDEMAILDERFGCLRCMGLGSASYKIKGVISINGGVIDLNILNNEDVKLLQFVGIDDHVVPSDEGYPFQMAVVNPGQQSLLKFLPKNFRSSLYDGLRAAIKLPYMYGALTIDEYAMKTDQINVQTEVNVFGRHSLLISKNGRKMRGFDDFIQKSVEFMHNDLIPNSPQISLPDTLMAGRKYTIKLGDKNLQANLSGLEIIKSQPGKLIVKAPETGTANLELSVINEFGLESETITQSFEISDYPAIAKIKDSFYTKGGMGVIIGCVMLLVFFVFRLIVNKRSVTVIILLLGFLTIGFSQQAEPNRGLGSAKYLSGEIYQLVIFSTEDSIGWSSNEKEFILDQMDDAEEWIIKQGRKYREEIFFVRDTISVDSLKRIFPSLNSTNMESAIKVVSDSLKLLVPHQNLNNFYAINFHRADGRSYAHPSNSVRDDNVIEYSRIYRTYCSSLTGAHTIAHEILHLFGAVDMYREKVDIKAFYRNKTMFPNEIMHTYYYEIGQHEVSEVTAWLVGWLEDWKEWYGKFW